MLSSVEHGHLVSVSRQETDYPGTYEAGSADDENAHSGLGSEHDGGSGCGAARPLDLYMKPEHGYNVKILIRAEQLCKPIR
jgi:hypothetical protein